MNWWAAVQIAAGVFLMFWGTYKARSAAISKSAAQRLVSFVIGLSGAYLAMAAFVENRPVVTPGSAIFYVIDRHPQGLTATLYAEKRTNGFGHCVWYGAQGWVIREGGSDEIAYVSYPHSETRGKTRDNGFQNFGVWDIRWDVKSEPVIAVYFLAFHRCGVASPITLTKIGPFPVGS